MPVLASCAVEVVFLERTHDKKCLFHFVHFFIGTSEWFSMTICDIVKLYSFLLF